MASEYNIRSPAVKRLMKEARELKDPTTQYYAKPLEDNLFEWHFTIRGAKDTPYENGYYHGRIVLPSEYPMKPPSILMLTPNGRFEINKKICLSMSAYHPELWQPSWSIRTALLAIIGFMPTDGAGAIGALDYPEGEKRRLAKLSADWRCSTCGMTNRSALLEGEDDESLSAEAADIASQMSFKSESEMKEALKKMSLSEQKGSPQGQDVAEHRDELTAEGASPSRTPAVRQRQPQQQQGTVPQQPSPQIAGPSQTQQRQQSKGTASLVVMWLLLLMIFILIARRAYNYFPDTSTSSFGNSKM